MPGSTPNRHYPYPFTGDSINPPRDIANLAQAIDADFGNFATAADLAGKLSLTGGELSGTLSTTAVLATGPQPTPVNALTRKDYVDGLAAGKLSLSGGTMTGTLTATTVLVTGVQNASAGALTRRDYVDTVVNARVSDTGDTMTGTLTIHPSASDLGLRLQGASPYMDFYSEAATPLRLGIFQCTPAGMYLNAEADRITFRPANVEHASISSEVFLYGKATSDLANAGVEIIGAANASAEGSLRVTTDNPTMNLYMRHVGAADVVGSAFMWFNHGASTSPFAVCSQQANGIAFTNTTVTAPSDYRLKNNLGPVADPLGRLLALAPHHLSWKSTGTEFDGFLAHEVDPVVPEAVYGEKDAVYGPPADDMQPPAGTPLYQQFDPTALIPLLVAAVQALSAEVDLLKAGA